MINSVFINRNVIQLFLATSNKRDMISGPTDATKGRVSIFIVLIYWLSTYLKLIEFSSISLTAADKGYNGY